jgi:hypothetical protein
MKGAQLGEEVLAQEPHLAAAEGDRDHEGRMNLAPKGLRTVRGGSIGRIS